MFEHVSVRVLTGVHEALPKERDDVCLVSLSLVAHFFFIAGMKVSVRIFEN